MNQAKVIKERLSKIQIQTIKMINIIRNETGKHEDYYYIINVLCELTSTTKFMDKAIQEKIFGVNKLEIIPINYEELFKLNLFPDVKIKT